ncbi:MAG: hypothetical protein AMXMBFR84_29550 [Candidatus Hydrogenedentota bacterium]
MPRFAFTAVDNSGAEHFGIVDVATEADAVNEVGRRGLIPVEVRHANITDDLRVRRDQHRQDRMEKDARRMEQNRKRHGRQRLVVRHKDGRIDYGVCFALNPKESTFHLDRTDKNGVSVGKTDQVRFSELKAVFYVKSFDGKYDKHERFREWTPEGKELVVEFQDGEVIRGYSLHASNLDEPRFFLIPEDQEGNNISILVERSAVKEVYTPEAYVAKKTREKEAKAASPGTPAVMTQEETMGDFYFETRNYEQALIQYGLASEKHGISARLRKKTIVSQFNIGVQYIKRRDYPRALENIEKVLAMDPGNEHAKKKAQQLRKILERPARGSDRAERPEPFVQEF